MLALQTSPLFNLPEHLIRPDSIAADMAIEKLIRMNKGLRMLATAKDRKSQWAHAAELQQVECFNRFMMKAPAGICVLSGPELTFESVNASFQLLFPDRPLIGKTMLMAMPEIETEPVYRIMKRVYETGITYEGTEELVRLAPLAEGTLEDRYFNFIYQARRNQTDQINGILVFVFDVTALVTAKYKLQQSEKNTRDMFNAISQIAFSMNLAGELTSVNQRWYDYTGLNFERDRKDAWWLTLHPDELADLTVKFWAMLRGSRGGEFELRKKRKDGLYFWHLCCFLPILDGKGNVLSWMGTSTNIELLKHEQQQKDDFLNIASHELKTPLTSLKACVQLINERHADLPPKLFSSLMARATTSLDKVVGLVEDLLNVGAFSQGQLKLNPTAFVLADLVKAFTADINATGRFDIRFTGAVSAIVLADALRIEQVLVNMINNAMKYAPASRVITIHIELRPEETRVSVSDEGPGIAACTLPRLFDRYYRVETNSYESSGLGIGLYICSEIVKKHGGEIGVNSKIESGTCFWFTLPR